MLEDNRIAIEQMLKGTSYLVELAMQNTTKVYDGLVKSDNGDGRWNIEYNGELHPIRPYGTMLPKIGQIVKVFLPQGNQALSWFFIPGDAGGGSSGGGADLNTTQVVLTVANWSNNSQTVSVSGVQTGDDVLVSPIDITNRDYVAKFGVALSSINNGSVTFSCETVPNVNIYYNVGVFVEGGGSGSGGIFIPSVSQDSAEKLNQSVALYVDANNGNDNNNGLTQETPKQTITAALKKIPKNLNGYSVTIYLLPGTYNEDVILIGYHNSDTYNGFVTIQGTAANNRDTTIINGNVSVLDTCVRFVYLTINGCVESYALTNLILTAVTVNRPASLTTAYTITVYNANLYFYNLAINNANYAYNGAYYGALHVGLGTVMGNILTGTNNELGVSVGQMSSNIPGLAILNAVSMQATTLYQKIAGGILFVNGSQV